MLGLFVGFFALLGLGVPVVFGMAISALGYLTVSGFSPNILIQRMTSQLMSFPFLAIPFFILLAEILNSGSAIDRLIRFVKALIGHWHGGLAQANALISIIFACVSGTALADCSSLGSTLIPAMEREGYSRKFSAAVTAATSAVGPIIPPSITMIIAGVTLQMSVSKLFFAGAVPGLLMGGAMMVVNYVISKKRGYPRSSAFSASELWASFKGCVFELFLMTIVLGGILIGWFTPTEAGAMGAFAALIGSILIRREMSVKKFYHAALKAAVASSVVLLIIGFAGTYGYILARMKLPETLATALFAITTNKYMVMIIINLFLIMVGMVMETNSAMIILLPTIVAVGNSVGVDSIQIVAMVVINFVLAGITPPVGMMLYVVCSVTNCDIFEVAWEAFPYLIACLCVLLLVITVPAVSLWLPNLLFP